jgi:hypothetical protein
MQLYIDYVDMQLFINDLRQKLLQVGNQAAIRLFHTVYLLLLFVHLLAFLLVMVMGCIMHTGYHEIKYFDATTLRSV